MLYIETVLKPSSGQGSHTVKKSFKVLRQTMGYGNNRYIECMAFNLRDTLNHDIKSSNSDLTSDIKP